MSAQQNEIFTTLNRTGPKTSDELPRHPTETDRRKYALRQFDPLPELQSVWHLARHDDRMVLQRWLTVNRTRLREKNIHRTRVAQALTGEMATEWQQIRSQYPELDGGHDGHDQPDEQETIDCPACGKPVANLAQHIHGPQCTP